MSLTIGAKGAQPLKRFTYQNFSAGEITGVNIALSKNQNGTKANNDPLDFISANVENDGTPIIVLQSDYETGVNDSLGDRIKVNSISGTTINLSAIPANNVAVAIWYRYLEPEPNIVKNSLEISPNIENNFLIETNNNKIDKITSPTANDVAKINFDGEIENSGIQLSNIELNTNKTTSFQQTPDNTRYPTEKLVKDNLDLKENVANKVNAFQQTPDNTKYPSEKLVKDNLDLKSNISDIKDDLTSNDTNKPLSANQGKVLQGTKANKVSGGTENNFLKRDASGDIADTGISGVSFNGANQLVRLDSNGKLAAIDGSQLTNLNTSGLPTGSIIPWEGSLSSLPTGWLYADGSTISRTIYSNLFSHTNTKFGEGDGSSTFSIPDYRGRALRGTDNGAGVDPDASSRTINGVAQTNSTSGTVQGDGVKQHTHFTVADYSAELGVSNTNAIARNKSGVGDDSYFLRGSTNSIDKGITSNGSGTITETRMKNIAVHYLIKY